MSLWLGASTLAVFIVSAVSVVAGPFDAYVGKYRGNGVERSDAVYYYSETATLEADSMTSTAYYHGYFTARSTMQFREDGKLRGLGRVIGYPYSWTSTGKWRQEGDVIKGRTITRYSDGSISSATFSTRFKDGKVISNASGYTGEGLRYTNSYKGKLQP